MGIYNLASMDLIPCTNVAAVNYSTIPHEASSTCSAKKSAWKSEHAVDFLIPK